ncbi:kinase-like domain-containing protein [Rhizophagus clarus]|uniref:Kinase-like domain-containing protein n=1 Tax=Rhizophagus clarus TaxID=94130 RepID=A0A8H3M3Q2_9GLOM|nr:kinase-like domain-containing protein [Rhizophagus clarus]
MGENLANADQVPKSKLSEINEVVESTIEIITIEAEEESKLLSNFLLLIGNVTKIYDEMVEICQKATYNKESCELMLSKVEKTDMALGNLRTYRKENLKYISENYISLRKLVNVIGKMREFLVEISQLKNYEGEISADLDNKFNSIIQLLGLNLKVPFENFLPQNPRKVNFLVREITKVYNEISEIYQSAQYNKKICLLMLKKVEIADIALNNLKVPKREDLKYFSKEIYINLCNLITISGKIRKILAEISQFESYKKFIQTGKNIETFKGLINEFNSTIQFLNSSSIISPAGTPICTGTESASKVEIPFASFLPLIKEVNKLCHEIDKIYRTAQYNEKTCKTMLERVQIADTAVKNLKIRNLEFFSKKNFNNFRNLVTVIDEIRQFLADISQGSNKYVHANDVKEEFINLNDEFETAVQLLQFYLIIYFDARDNNDRNEKIKVDIEEEWIKKKIEDEDIIFFKYNEFKNIEKIDKGGFGVVNKAKTNDRKQVALKVLSRIDESIIKNFVKELKLLRTVSYHDNINTFLGISKNDISYIMVLEYANEGNLRDYLRKKCSLDWKDKIQMALDITCGLKCLHFKEIIHRDLHSKNILVNNGRLLIADFGLSKQLTEDTSGSVANRMGMIEYIEPQCLRSAHYVKNKKSDIYSLGVLLWEITSGRPPFYKVERNLLGYHIGYANLREDPIEGTPLKYQQLYQICWDGDPKKRPDIDQVYDEIVKISSQLDNVNDNEGPLITSDSNNLNLDDIQSSHVTGLYLDNL